MIVSPEHSKPAPVDTRSSIWIRVFSRIPLALWYAVARFMAWCAWRPFPYRRHVVEANLKTSFPGWDDTARDHVIRDYYRGFADVFVEVFCSLRLTREQLARRLVSRTPK